jgi:hypothetical protein
MVPARGQIDVLDVPGRLTFQNSADKNPYGFVKASFVVLGLKDIPLLRKVVFHHLAPGNFVAACKNILKFGECLVPAPIQLGICLEEVWESLLIKNSIPRDPLSTWTRKLEFFWELRAIIPWPFVAEDGFAFEDTGHLGCQADAYRWTNLFLFTKKGAEFWFWSRLILTVGPDSPPP